MNLIIHANKIKSKDNCPFIILKNHEFDFSGSLIVNMLPCEIVLETVTVPP
jgi:hypothetical protein